MTLSVEQASRLQSSYEPGEDVKARLSGTTMVSIVGATAVGKNFLMERSGFHIVGRVTTREPREADSSAYEYVSQEQMLALIAEGQVVQFARFGDNVYASRPHSYRLNAINVGDVAFDAVQQFDGKGFKSTKSVSVVTDAAQWNEQLRLRFEGMRRHDAYMRLDEAKHSLRWTRAQALGDRASNHLVVINSPDSSARAVSSIQSFSADDPVHHPDRDEVRDYIIGMERVIRRVQDELL